MHSDQASLSAIQAVLSSEYETLAADSSKSALDVLSAQSVDVLVADGRLAAKDFLEQVERAAPNVLPVVLADSNSINGLMDVLRDDSFCLSVQGSGNPDEILQTVRNLLFPRSTGRLAVGGLIAELAMEGTAPLRVPVFDISNRGFSFHLHSVAYFGRLLPGTRILQLLIQRDGEPLGNFAAVVRSIAPLSGASLADDAKFKVGMEFLIGPDPEPEGALESITDPLRIAVLLRGALRRGGVLGQLADDEARPVLFRLGTVDAVNRTVALVGAEADGDFIAGDVFRGSFGLGGRNFSFLGALLKHDREGILVRFPRSVRASSRRENNRFTPSDQKPVEVEAITLLGQTIRRPALDLSSWGVALPISYAREILPVGTVLHRVLLRFPDGNEALARGRVRSLVPLKQAQSSLELPFKCGIRFEGLSLAERVRIANAIVRLGDEGVQDSDGLSFDDIWKLLQETGFMYPEKLRHLEPALPQIRNTLETLLRRPNRVFKTLVYRRNHQLQGHLSAFRAYRRTWVIQHLAARQSRDAQLATRTLNLGLAEYFDQIPNLEWFRIYFRVNNQWPARVFGTFARRLRDPALSEMHRMNYLVGPTIETLGETQYEVREAAAPERSQVEEYFVNRRRLIALDADDLYGAVLPLTDVAREYAQLGLRRERKVLVVTDRNRELLGFALLEISSAGLNLSELTNAFQIYTVSGDPGVKQALIQGAQHRYYREGRPLCIALAADEDLPDFEREGFAGTKQYNCWTCHRTLLHRYYEFIIRMSRQEGPRSEANGS